MHAREPSSQILEMSDFDELADFADLFTVPPSSSSSKFSRSPFSARSTAASSSRPESIAYPSGIPLELDLFDDEDEYVRGAGRISPGSESGAGGVQRAGIRMSTDDAAGILAGEYETRLDRRFLKTSGELTSCTSECRAEHGG